MALQMTQYGREPETRDSRGDAATALKSLNKGGRPWETNLEAWKSLVGDASASRQGSAGTYSTGLNTLGDVFGAGGLNLGGGGPGGLLKPFWESWEEAKKPVPEGLTPEQLRAIKARTVAGQESTTRQSLSALARSGAGPSSPLYGMQASMLRAGGAASAASQMAQIDIGETQRNQDLEMMRRSQMAQLGGVGGQLAGQFSGMGMNYLMNQQQMQHQADMQRAQFDEARRVAQTQRGWELSDQDWKFKMQYPFYGQTFYGGPKGGSLTSQGRTVL